MGAIFTHPLLKKENLTPKEQTLVFPQELVLTKTTRQNLERILYPLSEGRNLLLVGDAGVGKNALIYYINSLRGLPTIRFGFNHDTLPEDLIGSFRITPHGFCWNDGPLLHAMKSGYTFVADEMNLASAEILKRFLSVFEKKRITLIEKDRQEIVAHERFHFVATQNPTLGFEGRKILPESIKRYFTIIHLDPYPLEEEVEIMANLFPQMPSHLLEKHILIQRTLEGLLWQSKLARNDFEHYHFNIRTAIRFWRRFQGQKPSREEFLENIFRFYVFLFRHEEDRAIAREVVQSILSPTMEEMREVETRFHEGAEEGIVYVPEGSQDLFALTAKRLSLLREMQRSLEAGENLLLEADETSRPEILFELLAKIQEKKVEFLYLSKGVHTSDLIGALRPLGQGQEIVWLDGPLTTAVREGYYLVLDNPESCGSEIVEKLNMLLDDAGMLALPPESGERMVLKRHPNFRLIAIKRHRKTKSVPTISKALRNRFFSLQIPQIDNDEIREALYLAWNYFFPGTEKENKLCEKLHQFHLAINNWQKEKRSLDPAQTELVFYEDHLLRTVSHFARYLAEAQEPHELIAQAIEIHYLAQIPSAQEREEARKLWENLAQEISLEIFFNKLKEDFLKKKALPLRKDLPWDAQKHFREAITGRAKASLSGPPLKKGIAINTPETGGEIKEGPDAWYGRDTLGNKGVGEPQGGGGGWGYRTKEIWENFLEKYKPHWDYTIHLGLQDFYDAFGRSLADLEVDFHNFLDSDVTVKREYSNYGSRLDSRKYLTFTLGLGDDRIFDRRSILPDEEKWKGLEVIFLVNKGRRIFNSKACLASLIALQLSLEILWKEKIAFRVFGYSDFGNRKKQINLAEYTQGFTLEKPSYEECSRLFSEICTNWHGDTVEESHIMAQIPCFFSADSRTRLAVVISDFRGHRAKATLEKELGSRELQELYEAIHQMEDRGYVLLGVGTGRRNLAQALFRQWLWFHDANLGDACFLLAHKLGELIKTHYTPMVGSL
ncbi:MAG: AAA family ATPase [Leptospiraceae bacterium]|nr:AAA family ATPase [Leptospiraceae bacterium]